MAYDPHFRATPSRYVTVEPIPRGRVGDGRVLSKELDTELDCYRSYYRDPYFFRLRTMKGSKE